MEGAGYEGSSTCGLMLCALTAKPRLCSQEAIRNSAIWKCGVDTVRASMHTNVMAPQSSYSYTTIYLKYAYDIGDFYIRGLRFRYRAA